MRRATAGTLALTCMGISVGVTALVGPPVSADAPRVAAQSSAVVDASTDPRAEASKSKKSAARRYASQAHNATNGRRAEHGLAGLRRTKCVQRFAVKQARAMAAKESMYHQELGPILSQCGLSMVGENVAYGYPSGRAVVNVGWMNSDGHRANILNPGYRVMGLGARQSDDGTWYVAQVFGRKS